MRATSAKFLKPTESDEPDLREGWLKKLKAKFTDKEKILLEDEFENLDTVVLPKMSFFAQEEFYKALKSLTLYELQEGFRNHFSKLRHIKKIPKNLRKFISQEWYIEWIFVGMSHPESLGYKLREIWKL